MTRNNVQVGLTKALFCVGERRFPLACVEQVQGAETIGVNVDISSNSVDTSVF